MERQKLLHILLLSPRQLLSKANKKIATGLFLGVYSDLYEHSYSEH